MKSFEIKRWLKKVLKDKISINDRTIKVFLMTGLLGVSAILHAAEFFVQDGVVYSYNPETKTSTRESNQTVGNNGYQAGNGQSDADYNDPTVFYFKNIGIDDSKGAATKYLYDMNYFNGYRPTIKPGVQFNNSLKRYNSYDTIAIGSKDNIAQSRSAGSVAIGSGAYARGRIISLDYKDAQPDNKNWVLGNDKEDGVTIQPALAIGYKAIADGTNVSALGYNATAIGRSNSAFGASTRAKGGQLNAIGSQSEAYGYYSTVVGYDSTSYSRRSVTIGTQSYSAPSDYLVRDDGSLSTQLSKDNTAKSDINKDLNKLIELGNQWKSKFVEFSKDNVISEAEKDELETIKKEADKYENKLDNFYGIGNVSIGNRAVSLGSNNTTIGFQNVARGKNNLLFGSNSKAFTRTRTVDDNTGIRRDGENFSNPNDKTQVEINEANNKLRESTSVNNVIALGSDNYIKSNDIIAIGKSITGNIENAIYLGNQTTATKDFDNTKYTTAGSTAYTSGVYNGADPLMTRFTFYGKGAEEADILTIGNGDKARRIQNVATGLISKESTDAVNGAQLYTAVKQSRAIVIGKNDASVVYHAGDESHFDTYEVDVKFPIRYYNANGDELVRGADGKYYKPSDLENKTYVNGNWYNNTDISEQLPREGASPSAPATQTPDRAKLVNPVNANNSLTLELETKSNIGLNDSKLLDLGKDSQQKDGLTKEGLDKNTTATIGDLQRMGFVVESDKTTGNETTAYKDTIKNSQVLKFVGKGDAKVSGKTGDDGVRTITVSVDSALGDPVRYVKEDGTPVYKVGNKYYSNPDGTGDEVPKDNVKISLIGTDAKPATLDNVGSALGLDGTSGNDGKNGSTPLTEEQKLAKLKSPDAINVDPARIAVAGPGKDGKGGLLTKSGPELTKVVTLGDLQAVAKAGLTFVGNNSDVNVHRPLGTQLDVIGEGITKATSVTFKSASGNINVVGDSDKNNLTIKLSRNLKDLENAKFYTFKEDGTIDDTKGLTVIDNNGITISPSATQPNPVGEVPATVSLTKDGLDNGGNKIINVATPTDKTDAANKEYVDKVAAASKIVVTGSGAALVTKSSNSPITYNVHVDKTTTFVDDEGNELVKAPDGNYYQPSEIANMTYIPGENGEPGKWYNNSDLKEDGTPNDNAVAQNPATKNVAGTKLVNADGTTTNPVNLSNLKNALGDNLTGNESEKIVDAQNRLEKLVDSKDKDGKDLDLSKAATAADLQVLAQGGLNFLGNEEDAAANKVHRALGTTLKIEGISGTNYTDENKANYSAENLITHKDGDDTIRIELLKTPKFEGLKLNDGKDGSTTVLISPTKDGDINFGKDGKNGDDAKVVLSGIKDGDNPDSAVTKGAIDKLIERLGAGSNGETGVNGIDGRDGVDGTDGKDYGVPNNADGVGTAGKDGLNGTTIGNKVQGLRDGVAGPVVYTDQDGNRVLVENGKYYKPDLVDGKRKANDGLWYPNDSVNPDGSVVEGTPENTGRTLKQLADGTDKEVPSNKVMLSTVNPDGSTKDPVVLGNISSALNLDGTPGNNGKDGETALSPEQVAEALKNPKAIDVDPARIAIAGDGKDGKGGLLTTEGPALNRATTLGDLQAVAKAGLTFIGNNSDVNVHRPLGTELKVIGEGNKDVAANDFSSAANNIYVEGKTDSETNTNELIIKLAKRLDNLENATFKKLDDKNQPEAGEPTTVVSNNGITISPSTTQPNPAGEDAPATPATVSLTKDGLDNGGNRITNVAAPTAPTDAANKDYVDKARTKVTGSGAAFVVKSTTDPDTYNVHVEQTMAYVDNEGNPLVKGGDNKYYNPADIQDKVYVPGENGAPGNWYNSNDLNSQGKPKDNVTALDAPVAKEVAGTNLINPAPADGKLATKDPTKLSNVGGIFENNVVPTKLSATAPDETAEDSEEHQVGNVVEINKAINDTYKSSPTNVVNVADLKAVNEVANHGFIIKTDADGGKVENDGFKKGENINPENDTITFVAGEHIALKQEAGKITISTDNQKIVNAAQTPVEYVDADGNKVYKVGDNFYANETGPANPEDPDADKLNPKTITTALKGAEDKPTILGNLGSALELDGTPGNDGKGGENGETPLTDDEKLNALKNPKAIDVDPARIAIAGPEKNGEGGLLTKEGKELNRATTLGDLQAVAKAGLTFGANDGEDVHRPLGTKLDIVGKVLEEGESVDEYNYTFDNLATFTDTDKNLIKIGIVKRPEFEALKLKNSEEGSKPVEIVADKGGNISYNILDNEGRPSLDENGKALLPKISNVGSSLEGEVGNGSTDKAGNEANSPTKKGGNTFLNKLRNIGTDEANKEKDDKLLSSVVTVQDLQNLSKSPIFFAGDSGTDVSRLLGEKAKIVGGVTEEDKLADNNIGVIADGKDTLTVKLAKELKGLTNATFVKPEDAENSETTTVIDGSGISISPSATQPEIPGETPNIVTLTREGLNNGGNKILNVAKGELSPLSQDAVNGAQLYEVDQKVSSALGGIATAVAMANLPQINSIGRNNRHNVAASYGTYMYEHAFALGLSGVNKEGTIVYKVSGAVNTRGNVSFGAGLGYQFENKDSYSEYSDLKDVRKEFEDKFAELQNQISELKNKNNELENRTIKFEKLNVGKLNSNGLNSDQKMKVIDKLNELNGKIIVIDIVGLENNLSLGLEKAKKVKEFLLSLGIDSNLIKSVSSSESKASDSTVEIHIMSK